MGRPTNEERDARRAAAEWRKGLADHADAVMAAACEEGESIVVADRFGGRLTVEILGPDGEWRKYYVRLTEAAA